MRSLLILALWTLAFWMFAANDTNRVWAVEDGEAATRYRMVAGDQRSFRAILHVDAETNALTAKEWFLYAAHPPELPGQPKVTAKLSPAGKSVRELSPKRRPILMSRVKSSSKSSQRLEIEAEYQITLSPRQLVERRESDPPVETIALALTERPQWLVKSPQCTLQDREFLKWMDDSELRPRPSEDVVNFARRVLLFIRSNFEYTYLRELDRRASYVCREKKSDCLGLSILFVSVMRANQIPARILVGRWAQSSVSGDLLEGLPYNKEHVKCEFFAENVGWIPLDPASSLSHDRTTDGTRFFGHDPADFVTFHVDDTLIFDPGPVGRQTIPVLQDIRVWAIGPGKDGKLTMRETWTVERIRN